MKSLSCHSKRIVSLYCMVQVVHHKLISRLCRYPIRSSTLQNRMFGELTQCSKFSKSSCHMFPTPAVIIIRTSSHLHVVQGKEVSIYVLVMKRCCLPHILLCI